MRRALVALLCCAACGPPDPGSLSLVANPTSIDDKGEATTLRISAVDAEMKPGTGAVKVTATAGSLVNPETLTLDKDGNAETTFSCDVATDPRCVNRVRVVAEWSTPEGVVGAETRIQVGEVAGMGDGGTGGLGIEQSPAITVFAIVGTANLTGAVGGGLTELVSHPQILPLPNGFRKICPRRDGNITYVHGSQGALRELVVDTLTKRPQGGTALFDVTMNDKTVSTPGCNTNLALQDCFTAPTGQSIYQCGSAMQAQEYYDGARHLTGLDGYTLIAVGYNDKMLAVKEGGTSGQLEIVSALGGAVNGPRVTEYPWTAGHLIVRAVPDGFLYVRGVTGGGAEVMKLSFTGTETMVGTVSAPPAGWSVVGAVADDLTDFPAGLGQFGALDNDGNVYVTTRENSNRARLSLTKLPLAGGVATHLRTSAINLADFNMFPPAINLNLSRKWIVFK